MKIYTVDLSNKMNADTKYTNPTLIKVKKGKVVETLTTTQDIYSAIDGVKFN